MGVVNNFIVENKCINVVYNDINTLYLDKVQSLINRHFEKEDIEGYSNLMEKINYYQAASILTFLVYQDFKQGESMSNIKTFYCIDELIECFRCAEIDLNKYFNVVNINFKKEDCKGGIESDAIGKTFQIERQNCATESIFSELEKVDIDLLLNETDFCTNLIKC